MHPLWCRSLQSGFIPFLLIMIVSFGPLPQASSRLFPVIFRCFCRKWARETGRRGSSHSLMSVNLEFYKQLGRLWLSCVLVCLGQAPDSQCLILYLYWAWSLALLRHCPTASMSARSVKGNQPSCSRCLAELNLFSSCLTVHQYPACWTNTYPGFEYVTVMLHL